MDKVDIRQAFCFLNEEELKVAYAGVKADKSLTDAVKNRYSLAEKYFIQGAEWAFQADGKILAHSDRMDKEELQRKAERNCLDRFGKLYPEYIIGYIDGYCQSVIDKPNATRTRYVQRCMHRLKLTLPHFVDKATQDKIIKRMEEWYKIN